MIVYNRYRSYLHVKMRLAEDSLVKDSQVSIILVIGGGTMADTVQYLDVSPIQAVINNISTVGAMQDEANLPGSFIFRENAMNCIVSLPTIGKSIRPSIFVHVCVRLVDG